jgi:hypothetical protein
MAKVIDAFRFNSGRTCSRISRAMSEFRAPAFHHDRLPPLRELAPLTARSATELGRPAVLEEIGLELPAQSSNWMVVFAATYPNPHRAITRASRT